MRKVFRKFKGNLKCPDSDIEIYSQTTLKVIHDSWSSNNTSSLLRDNNNNNNPEKVLQQSCAEKLKKSSFEKVCVICGSTNDIEMHHLSPGGVPGKRR
jgi:primase-polymerase (primpol)-like protein